MAKTTIAPRDPRLDRRTEFDEQSREYPIRTLIAPDLKPRSYTWSCSVQLDQGREGACVGFSIAQEAAARPVVVPGITNEVALEVYRKAQELDSYDDTPPESGTSVLAGAKAATERGWYSGYRWGFSLEDALLALGYHGPVVFGLNWYTGMMEMDSNGFLHPTGIIEGGHAILGNSVNVKQRWVGFHNSWGGAVNGKISFDDLDTLLHEQGESMIPIKRGKPTA